MKFKKGEPRHPDAGRKKGSPNKKSLLKVAEYFAERGLHPVEEIMKLVMSPESDLKTQEKLSVWWEILGYCEDKNPGRSEENSAASIFDQFNGLSDDALSKLAKQ